MGLACGELRTLGKGPCTLPALAGIDFGSKGVGTHTNFSGPASLGQQWERTSEEFGVPAKHILGAQLTSVERVAR